MLTIIENSRILTIDDEDLEIRRIWNTVFHILNDPVPRVATFFLVLGVFEEHGFTNVYGSLRGFTNVY